MRNGLTRRCGALLAVLCWSATASAQDHMAGMQMPMAPTGWHAAQDGVVTGIFNHQGGPRGGDEFVAPNWWMGMLMREHGHHALSLNLMLSLDPATVGRSGYRELFQVGEALDGTPLIDRQHPHDLFSQVAASWRARLAGETTLILAGGPAGESTLGPVAFMHRRSAAGLLLAPLGHHTFDSTHISYGVVTAAIERGRWAFEGSAFNGREPDDNRWDFDFGRMDSVAGRIWFRPTKAWDLQVSTGRLRHPEALEPGDVQRTTTSASWFRADDSGFAAATVAYGVNAANGQRRHGLFGEFTRQRGANSIFGRAEFQDVETSLLLTGEVPEQATDAAARNAVTAVTAGADGKLMTWKGFEGALGAALTLYGVPDALKATHGRHPVSFQTFFRLRLPAGNMGRMWDMRMSAGRAMDMPMDHGNAGAH